MTRLSLILLAILLACALGVVTSQHQARKLHTELEREQARARQLEIEFGQLQLEQRTWAMPARIEKVATHQLGMQLPPASRVQVVSRVAVPVATGAGATVTARGAEPRP